MNWQNQVLVELIKNDPSVNICAVCNDCSHPLYFTRKYNKDKDDYDVQFIWKLTDEYKVTGVTEYHLLILSSMELDGNYRNAVQILRGIVNGEKVIRVEHPYIDNYFCHMTESLYGEMLEASL
jgi:hypothetical protein